jgi:hypothetical protein
MANRGVITKDHHDAYTRNAKCPRIDDALCHATALSEPLGIASVTIAA